MAKLKSLLQSIKDFADTLSRRGLPTYAASCAFYMFLSLFPMAVLAASLLPCVGVSEAALLHLLDGIVPAGVAPVLQIILTNVYEAVFPVLPLSLLTLLWSSAQAFSELFKGMAAMTASTQTNYWKRRLRAILMTAALLTTLLVSLAVLIFGARLALLLGLMFPQATELLVLILRLRHLVMAALLWLLFVLLYRSIPGQRYSFRDVRLGAAMAAGAWIVFSALFSVYADTFVNLTLYGSMAAMAMTMLWLFYCQYILLIGAGICANRHSKKEAARL